MSGWLETNEGNRIPLHGACLMGRSNQCQIVLPDTCISRRHTLIQQQGVDEYWVVDLGSSNGTRLNGRRLSQPRRLKPRDSIGIHAFEFRFGCAPRLETHVHTKSFGLHAEITKRLSKLAIESVESWLLLADIDGSTRLSQITPADEWSQIVGHWLLQCRDDVESVGGTVNKYLGDGLFAYLLDGPEAAPRIRELIGKLATRQPEHKPPFRVVLHHGPITLGGVSASGEESLLGPEVNFVFKLEKVAGQLAAPIALSAGARQLWPVPAELASLGRHGVPGFDDHHEVFKVVRPPPLPPGPPSQGPVSGS